MSGKPDGNTVITVEVTAGHIDGCTPGQHEILSDGPSPAGRRV